MSATAPLMLDGLGDADVIVYTPASGAAVTLDGWKRRERIEEIEGSFGFLKARTADFVFRADPDATEGGVASPDLNGTLTHGGEAWSLRPEDGAAIEKTSTWVVAKAVRPESIERSTGPGYRT